MSVPEPERPENWAELSPQQRAAWYLEPITDELADLYVTILGKGGLNLPADMVKHLTNDERALAISTFFSRGTERHTLADQFQLVMQQIVLERMTEAEQRRAGNWMLQHWPSPARAEQSPPAAAPKRKRQPTRNPSRLAKWEAHWQAEQAAEGDQ